jgi:ubiquinone/menaquinone biosynthesis C-methylase UbiE
MTRLIPFPNRTATASAEAVQTAYDPLAPAYDAFTAGIDYDAWLTEVERVARRHGLRGRRVLDIACGTGKSFMPLLERGYAVTACDCSPEMVRRALAKAPEAVVVMADMRALPDLGRYDLVTCLEDAFNCQLHTDDLRGALAGIARSLGAGGVVEARIDAFRRRGTTWERASSRHRQRHWPVAEVRRLAEEAGLEVLDVLGQAGDRLDAGVDEDVHGKALFVARRAS